MAALENEPQELIRPKTSKVITGVVIISVIVAYWLLAHAVQAIDLQLSPSSAINDFIDDFPLLAPFLFHIFLYFIFLEYIAGQFFFPVAQKPDFRQWLAWGQRYSDFEQE